MLSLSWVRFLFYATLGVCFQYTNKWKIVFGIKYYLCAVCRLSVCIDLVEIIMLNTVATDSPVLQHACALSKAAWKSETFMQLFLMLLQNLIGFYLSLFKQVEKSRWGHYQDGYWVTWIALRYFVAATTANTASHNAMLWLNLAFS